MVERRPTRYGWRVKGRREGQCAACGLEDAAEYDVVVTHRPPEGVESIPGVFAVCEACWRTLIAVWERTPDRGREPLEGYT